MKSIGRLHHWLHAGQVPKYNLRLVAAVDL
jgi:hypothetical protein